MSPLALCKHALELTLLANSEGEVLPEFPPPSRGEAHGLRPFMTVREAIANIDPQDYWHDVEEKREHFKCHATDTQRSKPVAAWDEPLKELVDTGGCKYLHPDGDREFTVREVMRLMRFRDQHQIVAPNKKHWNTLMGNAVPRDLMTKIYKIFIKLLEESDRKILEYLQSVTIDVDDDDDGADNGGSGPPSRDTSTPSTPSQSSTTSSSRATSKASQRKRKTDVNEAEGGHRAADTGSQSQSRVWKRQRSQRQITDSFSVKKELPLRPAPTPVEAQRTRTSPFGKVVDLTEDSD